MGKVKLSQSSFVYYFYYNLTDGEFAKMQYSLISLSFSVLLSNVFFVYLYSVHYSLSAISIASPC